MVSIGCRKEERSHFTMHSKSVQAIWGNFTNQDSVEDKSQRYIAQENVAPLTPERFTAEEAEKTFDVTVGKWFRRFDPSTATFVSNIRIEYPED